MSLGGARSDVFNSAIDAAYKAGILTIVAAGNSNSDVVYYSPASAPNAVTVASIDENNTKPGFSNYGSLVDIFAPGMDILSTWIGSTTAVERLSGTSMATPHVAGLALYLMAKDVGLKGPEQIVNRIEQLGTRGVVQSAGFGSVNLLAFNGISP